MESVAIVMREVLAMPVERLLDMGERGRRLVAEKYEASMVSRQMIGLYKSIIDC